MQQIEPVNRKFHIMKNNTHSTAFLLLLTFLLSNGEVSCQIIPDKTYSPVIDSLVSVYVNKYNANVAEDLNTEKVVCVSMKILEKGLIELKIEYELYLGSGFLDNVIHFYDLDSVGIIIRSDQIGSLFNLNTPLAELFLISHFPKQYPYYRGLITEYDNKLGRIRVGNPYFRMGKDLYGWQVILKDGKVVYQMGY